MRNKKLLFKALPLAVAVTVSMNAHAAPPTTSERFQIEDHSTLSAIKSDCPQINGCTTLVSDDTFLQRRVDIGGNTYFQTVILESTSAEVNGVRADEVFADENWVQAQFDAENSEVWQKRGIAARNTITYDETRLSDSASVVDFDVETEIHGASLLNGTWNGANFTPSEPMVKLNQNLSTEGGLQTDFAQDIYQDYFGQFLGLNGKVTQTVDLDNDQGVLGFDLRYRVNPDIPDPGITPDDDQVVTLGGDTLDFSGADSLDTVQSTFITSSINMGSSAGGTQDFAHQNFKADLDSTNNGFNGFEAVVSQSGGSGLADQVIIDEKTVDPLDDTITTWDWDDAFGTKPEFLVQ